MLPPGRPSSDEAGFDRIAADVEDDRNGRGRSLGGGGGRYAAARNQNRYRPTDQFGRKRRQPLGLALCPAKFERHVLTLDVAGFLQADAEGGDEMGHRTGRRRVKDADHRHRSPRACDARPKQRSGHNAPQESARNSRRRMSRPC